MATANEEIRTEQPVMNTFHNLVQTLNVKLDSAARYGLYQEDARKDGFDDCAELFGRLQESGQKEIQSLVAVSGSTSARAGRASSACQRTWTRCAAARGTPCCTRPTACVRSRARPPPRRQGVRDVAPVRPGAGAERGLRHRDRRVLERDARILRLGAQGLRPHPDRGARRSALLTGDVSLAPDSTSQLHLHVVLGKRDGTAHGGHLLEAEVRPTLEVMVTETPPELRRRHDPESGLALIEMPPPAAA